MLGKEADAAPQALRAAEPNTDAVTALTEAAAPRTWQRYWNTVQEVGKPLLLGALVFAVVFSALSYALVNLSWHWRVRRLRHQRERLARQRVR